MERSVKRSMIDKAKLVDKYKLYRENGKRLNSILTSGLSKKTFLDAAGLLGLRSGDTLVFESEYETDVLMDYIIYDYYHKGKNAVEQYAERNQPKLGTTEHILLDAMLEARYSLYQITAVYEGLGVNMLDLLKKEEASVMDFNLSDSVIKGETPMGLIMAGRLVFPEKLFCMTTGAMLPVVDDSIDKILDFITKNFPERDFLHNEMDLSEQVKFSTFTINTLLNANVSEHIRFENQSGMPVQAKPKPKGPYPGTSRNAPCPCGSGEKYKKCCLKKAEKDQ